MYFIFSELQKLVYFLYAKGIYNVLPFRLWRFYSSLETYVYFEKSFYYQIKDGKWVKAGN